MPKQEAYAICNLLEIVESPHNVADDLPQESSLSSILFNIYTLGLHELEF